MCRGRVIFYIEESLRSKGIKSKIDNSKSRMSKKEIMNQNVSKILKEIINNELISEQSEDKVIFLPNYSIISKFTH